jgi:hypothetical protein
MQNSERVPSFSMVLHTLIPSHEITSQKSSEFYNIPSMSVTRCVNSNRKTSYTLCVYGLIVLNSAALKFIE